MLGAALFVSKDDAVRQEEGYDIWGAVTCTAGMLAIVYAIVEIPSRGLHSPHVIATAMFAVICLTAFVRIEKKVAHPLLDLNLLRNRKLVWASIVAAAILGTYMSFQFIGTLYLQANRGWSPIEMAFAFLPIGLLIALFAPRMGGLIERFGVHWMITAGFVAYALSYANFIRIGEETTYLWVVLPSVVLIGIAFPLSFPAANVLATTGIAENRRGVAAGILQTGYQLGAAIVLAVTTAVMGGDSQRLEITQYHDGLWLLLGLSALTIAGSVAATCLLRDKRASR
ncbi:MFS transporter [Roseibium sp. M-1]